MDSSRPEATTHFAFLEPMSLSRERIGVSIIVAALIAPAVALGARAAGAPRWLALALTALTFCGVPPLARRLPRTLDGLARRSRALTVVWCLVALAAVAQTARLAVFMDAPSRTAYSVLPWDTFWRVHSCYSAYVIAADRVRHGDYAIYQMPMPDAVARYEAAFAPLGLDDYLYPPTFLVLPRLGLTLSDNVFVLRRAWFAIEIALLALGLGLVARMAGGWQGLRAGLLAPAVWAATPILLTLQIGNVQLATYAVGMLALVAIQAGQAAVGGVLIAVLATGKLYPGILVVPLLARRQWRPVIWTGVLAAGIAAIALAIVTPETFRAFAASLPSMSHGDLFFPPSIDDANRARLASVNFSVFGLVMKLRQLGVPHLGPRVADAIGWIYTLVFLVLLWRASVRAPAGLRLTQVWLAALVLAAARSPFVPSAYGAIGAFWLFTLLAAENSQRRRWFVCIAGFLTLVYVVPDGHVGFPSQGARLTIGLIQQLIVFGVGLFVLAREAVGQPASALIAAGAATRTR